LTAACAHAPALRTPASPRAEALFARGVSLQARGDSAGAEAAFRAAIDVSPRFVRAHRALQILLEVDFRGHELRPLYRTLAETHRSEAVFHYLLGRILPEPEAQARAFRRALEREPDGYWGNLGMGYALFQDRSFRASRTYFERALKARPRAPKAWRFLAETRIASQDFPKALEALRQASLHDPEDTSHAVRAAQILYLTGRSGDAFEVLLGVLDAEAYPSLAPRALLRRFLRDEGTHQTFRRAAGVEGKVLSSFPQAPAALAFAGYLALERGNAVRAADLLERALAGGAPPSRVRLDLRRARFELGCHREGYDAWAARTRPLWDREDNESAARYRTLGSAVGKAAAKPDDGGTLTGLGHALLDCGWVREAVPVFRRAAARGSGEAQEGLSRARTHLEFLRELRLYFGGAYRRFLEHEDGGDLESVFRGVSALSRKVLGRDLGSGNPVRSFFLVGAVLDASPGTRSPLLEYFDSFNQVFILGRKAGGTPEAVLMTSVHRNRNQRFDHLGEPVHCDYVAGEDFALESFNEYLGGALLGVTLLGRFYTNLDKTRDRDASDWRACLRARRHRVRLARFGSWRASGRREALVLDAGEGLAPLLRLAAYRGVEVEGANASPPPAARGAYRGVIDHEVMHVKDANRYLPVGAHPFAALGLAIRHGFSQTSIEAAMEERAALAALTASARPHLELAHLLAFAPYPESRLPHSRGYCRLLRQFLARLHDHAESYPAVDPGRNLCRQLHRLTAEEVRDIARALAREEGLIE
jgi:tetratricopeptide (TPR) repeat protein